MKAVPKGEMASGMLFGIVGASALLEAAGRYLKQNKMEEDSGFIIRTAVPADVKYVYPIIEEMERSARERGTGISRRSAQSLCRKIYEGKAVIALAPDQEWAGFSYIESWSEGAFVSNSGLIVRPEYRRFGIARAIKERTFQLSRTLYPQAKIFSITTGAAVMGMNHQLGFRPVTYGEITKDEAFWSKCRSCVNYGILESKERKMCLCTAMLYDPEVADQRSRGRKREVKVA